MLKRGDALCGQVTLPHRPLQVELKCREDMEERPLGGGALRPVPVAVQMARHLRWLAPRITCVRDLECVALVCPATAPPPPAFISPQGASRG